MNRIAVLGAGPYNINVYKKLREGGYYTIAIDGNINARASSFADEFVHLDFSDRDKLLSLCESLDVDAIMPINEWGITPAAYVATKLNLKGNTMETALAATDKGIMRTVWKKAGLPVPEYFVFETFDELKIGVKNIGYPCVVKPTFSGGGGRGISVLRGSEDLEWAFNFAMPEVRYGEMICEAFVSGTELTIESISIDGVVHILATSDKEKPDLRTRVATSINYPANISNHQLEIVEEIVKKAVLALGIINGMAHTEVIIKGSEVILVETGARGGGSHIFPLIIEAVSGISAPVLFADILCGKSPNLPEVKRMNVIYRFFNPPSGILKEIHGLEEVKQWPGILDIGILKKPGEEVGNLKNSLERAGHVVCLGQDRDAAKSLANKVEKYIQFILE